MRPVRRGASPRSSDFDAFQDAKVFLIARMGAYCSYCERSIPAALAVEHIQPKAGGKYPELIGRWENFLLACVNCNSAKGDQDVILDEFLLPDRDNTFAAFSYLPDGRVEVGPNMASNQVAMAEATLRLVGLNKQIADTTDENGKMIAMDRLSQRLQAFLLASEARDIVADHPDSQGIRYLAVQLAKKNGFFSIWMHVFEDDADMRNRLVEVFEGTKESGCFDSSTSAPVLPAPNPDGLPFGGKR